MSTATTLIDLAGAEADLFHWSDACFATITIRGHVETHALRSRGFRSWLSKRLFEQQRCGPSSEVLASAIHTLEGIARFDGQEVPVGVRIQSRSGKIYIDLTNDLWQVIEVSPANWRIIESRDCPVRFRRAHGMLALPTPECGGDIDDLRPFLNVSSNDGFVLASAWMIGALHPTGPYPVLILQGEQGSAKTTTARFLRALIDPNLAPVRSEPREPRDLMIAANNGWVCAFDNLSSLQPWLSDGLCRLSTGGGFGTRVLYTDDEEIIFQAKRPAILTGIEDLAVRGDLLDRALIVELPCIREEKCQSEEQLMQNFELAKPRLIGSLLDAVSIASSNQSNVNLDRRPRMADFTVWVAAAERALGWKAGTFLNTYTANRQAANAILLDTPVGDAVRRLTLPWTGTATELLAALGTFVDRWTQYSRSWPKTPQELSGRLRRLAPSFRRLGILIEFDREGGTGRRLIAISERACSASSHSSHSSQETPGQPVQCQTVSGNRGASDECDDEIRSFRVEGEL